MTRSRALTVPALVAVLAIAAFSAHAQSRPEPHGVFPARITAGTAVDLKMDAALRTAIERYAEVAAAAKAGARAVPDAASLFPSAMPYRLVASETGGEPLAPVFVKLDRPESIEALTAAGATVVLQQQDLALVRIPVSRVKEAALSSGVRAMSLARRWEADLDSSRIRSRVKDVQAGAGTLPQPYLGDGVIVGVLDTGLDYTHDDFRNSATDSRVLALYDYAQGTDGVECTAAQLDSSTCGVVDGSGGTGHGTHVTGIAAGNGRLNPKYTGMAPHADLLFVKGMRDPQSSGGFSEDDVVSGCAWMLNKALALGKPIAINLSLGSQFGAHDGTSIEEQVLDSFTGPGRIIVAAAGNAGQDPVHVSYPVQGTSYQDGLESGIVLGIPLAVVDLWAAAGSNLKVGVIAYHQSDITTPIFVSNAAAPGQLVQQIASTGGPPLGQVTIDARTTVDPNNGDMNVLIQIEQATGGVNPSTLYWSVYTYGSGTFDMWLVTPGIFFPPGVALPAYYRPGNSDKTVGIPATAKRILCVGSHVTKTKWIDINGNVQTESGAVLDAVSQFSSHGPSRDGRALPNLTAPGEAVVSALSKDYPAIANDSTRVVQGGGYQVLSGTSMASPHITGIAALMLERDPALTPENIRNILRQTAIPSCGPDLCGAGRVQALAALQATPDPLQCTVVLPSGRTVPCEELAQEPVSLMAYPNPSSEGIRFSFTSPTHAYVDLAIYDLMGRRLKALRSEDMAAGVFSASWNGDDESGRRVPGGIYFARLALPSGTRTIRLMVRR